MNIQIRLFRDALSSYGSWSSTSKKVLVDDDGKKYTVKTTVKEVPCHCHPETCCHLGGKYEETIIERVYQ
jgi:hypothetical protein